jgi:peptidoglycan biosynthesis protein MviN/MurJ (putative lipid II flippase)
MAEKKIEKILNHKSKTITSAAFILIIATFIAKLTALFRDRIIASIFGATRAVDIYYSAFRLARFYF